MEKFIDNILENVFGGIYLQLNLVIGILLIGVGIASLVSLKNKTIKGRKIIAVSSICVGCLGILTAIIQLLLK